ncbi:zinc finger X-linked protein ZXDB-like [Passer montanus]|uniref:zinc finger X-linked protein ZXDB-like n=1 Tax=Passer montanus TaxID=9160 RepID=UPI00195F5807|nr:zinc finger X-linked protein ZXDB-like [Passer montanus]
MATLGSHRHSGNNRMSGPDMSSREKKHSSVWPRRGKGARCPVREPAALVPCPARASSSEGLSAAQPGRGATLGAAGQATNSCRRPARRGIATGAGGGTGSSGSCEKASGAAGRGGGRSGGAEEEEAAGAARALPPGTAPLRRPPKAAGLRPPVRASAPRARPPEPPRHARAAGAAASPALPALALPVPLQHCLPAPHSAAASAQAAERHRSPGRFPQGTSPGFGSALGPRWLRRSVRRVQLPRGAGLAGGRHCAASGFHVTKDVLLHGFVLLHEENVNQNAEETQ